MPTADDGQAMTQQKPAPPQLCLVTPSLEDTRTIMAALDAALAAVPVAAVLLRLADAGENTLVEQIKTLAPVVQNRGPALLLYGRSSLVGRSGADGAHLAGVDAFTEALPSLKPGRIAGCGELTSRDDAMRAGEAGADYVMFGEPDGSGHRPSFQSIAERIGWWTEVFEVPCVGFAESVDEAVEIARARAEFIALGDLVFADPRGAARALSDVAARLAATETIS